MTDEGRTLKDSMDHPPLFLESDLQIVLLGKVGAGKSASGNTIIGRDRETFKEGFLPGNNTKICQSSHVKVNGKKITVIDTIGLPDLVKETKTEQIFDYAEDGLDVFLLVIKLGDKYTPEEENNMKRMWIKEIFGAKSLKHTIVLFTHVDQLMESIEECLSQSDTLRSLVDQCAGRYHVFNNRNDDRSQVTELLRKIESLRMMNRKNTYTKHDYKQNQRDLEKCNREAAEERERLINEAEERERLIKEAEERERLLKEAKERERLLKEATEENKRLLKEAKERERLLKEATEENKRLLKEAEERERLLKEATEENKRLLKEAEERERLLKEAEDRSLITAVVAAAGAAAAAALPFIFRR